MSGSDDQAARDARAKAIRDAIAQEIAPEAESQADGSTERPRSPRELTDAAAAEARERSGPAAP